MARHKPERGRHLTSTHALESLKTRPDGFTQIAGICFWPSQPLEEFNSFEKRFAYVGRLGTDVGQNDQIGIKALLLSCHFGAANKPVLLQFALNRVTGLIEEIAFPDLITHDLAAQLLLLVVRSVKSDQF